MTTRTKVLLSIGIVIAITLSVVLIYAAKKLGLKNKNPKRILFVGDSQVAIQTDSGSPIGFTYPNILRSQNTDKTIDVIGSVEPVAIFHCLLFRIVATLVLFQ
jgi:hypothetical protein